MCENATHLFAFFPDLQENTSMYCKQCEIQ